jgi:transcriptional regulator with XRE-family HTH domain
MKQIEKVNQVKKVMAHLVSAYPEAKVDLTEPARDGGVWWLDVALKGKRLVIEWNPSTGFGITTPDADSFGERADESYSSFEKAIRRIDQLLGNDERTSPPFAVLLARLREKRGVTQQELASKLGIRQASISGLERREDLQLSTLRKVIQALGGCVQIYARFPEGRFTLEDSACESGTLVEEDAPPGILLSKSEIFVQLKTSGKFERAMNVTGHVKKTRAVIEMV